MSERDDDVNRAIIANQAHTDSLEARLAKLEGRVGMDMPHPAERSHDRKKEDEMRKGGEEALTAEDDGHRTAGMGLKNMTKPMENPRKIPYNKDQTGMFRHPQEKDGGSAVTAAMEMLPGLAAQRSYAAHPSLTAAQREEATRWLAMKEDSTGGEEMTPEDRLKRQKLAAEAHRIAQMEEAGRMQRAAMGHAGTGAFGRMEAARTAPLEARVAALEERHYGAGHTRARMAQVAEYAGRLGLDPTPYMAMQHGMSPLEIDAMNEAGAGEPDGAHEGQPARTAALSGPDDGMFELTPEIMEALR